MLSPDPKRPPSWPCVCTCWRLPSLGIRVSWKLWATLLSLINREPANITASSVWVLVLFLVSFISIRMTITTVHFFLAHCFAIINDDNMTFIVLLGFSRPALYACVLTSGLSCCVPWNQFIPEVLLYVADGFFSGYFLCQVPRGSNHWKCHQQQAILMNWKAVSFFNLQRVVN